MRKVKLVLEHLMVESFETSAARGSGTVVGADAASYPECPSPLCMDTPLASCDGSCRPGCGPQPTVDTIATAAAAEV